MTGESTEEGRERMRFAYELSWRRSEAAGPPTQLLDDINRRFEVISFDILSSPG